MREEEEISAEVRKYFELVEREYNGLRAGKDEFTSLMYQKARNITKQQAKTELGRRIEKGELSVRVGLSKLGRPCRLYKVMVK